MFKAISLCSICMDREKKDYEIKCFPKCEPRVLLIYIPGQVVLFL